MPNKVSSVECRVSSVGCRVSGVECSIQFILHTQKHYQNNKNSESYISIRCHCLYFGSYK